MNVLNLTAKEIANSIAFINVGGFALKGKGRRIAVSSVAEAKANWKGGKARGGEILDAHGNLIALMSANGRMWALSTDVEYRNSNFARLSANESPEVL